MSNVLPELSVTDLLRIPLQPLTEADWLQIAGEQPDTSLLLGSGWRFNLLALNSVAELSARNGTATLDIPTTGRYNITLTEALEYLLRQPVRDLESCSGGWIGAFSYEALHQLEEIALPEIDLIGAPQISFQLADSYLYRDNSSSETGLLLIETSFSHSSLSQRREQWLSYLAEAHPSAEESDRPLFSGLLPLIRKPDYLERVHRIREHIAAGDIYQANFTYPVQATAEHPVTGGQIISRLLRPSGSRYAAWLRDGDRESVSLSPESFLEKRGQQLLTRPIKGTCARPENPAAAEKARQELLSSSKNLAELSMIVDLERNDLGKIAAAGSVKMEQHAGLLELPSLYHLQSTISGRLSAEPAELFPALFPGGSITGAPKIRAMQIISELEQYRRGVYTGAIGWLGLNGELELNVAIRTLQRYREHWYLAAGGGIVFDSDPEEEYRETLAKLYSFSGMRLREEA